MEERSHGQVERSEVTQETCTLRGTLEALLFAADEPLSWSALQELVGTSSLEELTRVLKQLALEFAGPHRGIHLVEVAGGFQLRTNPDFHAQVIDLYKSTPSRLSKAAMETLAVIAYRQPVTRVVIEEIRGVECSGLIRKLSELELVHVVGKMDDIGRPNLYGTTPRFLEYFGLNSVGELPTLQAFEPDDVESYSSLPSEMDDASEGNKQ
jgi:segregation and condensation protein B